MNELPQAGDALSRGNTNFTVGSSGVQTVNLRGLGSGRTLTLVNGRRWVGGQPGEGYVDLNSIPTDLIDRLEVITGGASSVYGSDAIAGVVNIILVDGIEDTSVQVRVGAHQPFTNRSAGESVNIEISGGQYFDNGSMVWGVELNTVNPLNGKDREQLDDVYDEPVGYYHYGSWAGKLSARGYSGYGFYPNDSGALNTTCEDLNMITANMGQYGWGSSDYTDPTGTTWPALGYSYDTNWNYCNPLRYTKNTNYNT